MRRRREARLRKMVSVTQFLFIFPDFLFSLPGKVTFQMMIVWAAALKRHHLPLRLLVSHRRGLAWCGVAWNSSTFYLSHHWYHLGIALHGVVWCPFYHSHHCIGVTHAWRSMIECSPTFYPYHHWYLKGMVWGVTTSYCSHHCIGIT